MALSLSNRHNNLVPNRHKNNQKNKNMKNTMKPNTLNFHLFNAQMNLTGFSYNIHDGGLNPDKGYMVAIKGHEEIAPKDCDLIAFGRDYFLRHANELANPFNYMGCWYNDGQFVFDISENIQTKEVAIALGEQQEQSAIWDCVSGSEYRLMREFI